MTETPSNPCTQRESETHTHILNIYQRRNLAKIIVRETAFSKVKTEGLKYAYLPIDQIKPVVEAAWNDAGIVMDIRDERVEDVRPPYEKTSQYGDKSVWFHKSMRLKVALVNIDDPEDEYCCVITGEAKDNSDKVFNKLYTAALKNLYKIEFNIAERKDDTDELQDEEAIEVANGAKKGAWRTQQVKDPFFAPKEEAPQETPKRKSSDEVTLDRPIEQIRQSLSMFLADPDLSDIVNPARQAWGGIPKWSDEQCRQIYLRCVRSKQEGEQ